jgi:hypothetical protein
MLEAILGVLLTAAPTPAPARDPAKEAYNHAKQVQAPAPCPECRDTCAPPPTQKCRALCTAGKMQACSALGLALMDTKRDEALGLLKDAAAKHERAAEAAVAKVETDPAKAAALLGESCGLEFWPACAELALSYEKKDFKFALELHRRACKAGFASECDAVERLKKPGGKNALQSK